MFLTYTLRTARPSPSAKNTQYAANHGFLANAVTSAPKAKSSRLDFTTYSCYVIFLGKQGFEAEDEGNLADP